MVQVETSELIRIPKLFLDDHEDRGLDTPVIHKATARHYWVAPYDPALVEFVDDAVYYAHDVDACERGLVASARATLNALRYTPGTRWRVA